MKNVNDILGTRYYNLLQGALGVTPVFRDYVPNDLQEDNYVLISAVNSTDIGAMNGDFTLTAIQVGMYSRTNTDISGNSVNAMADIVYETIRPQPINRVLIGGFQVLTTELVNDFEPPVFDTGSKIFRNRFITFQHKIYHKGSSGSPSTPEVPTAPDSGNNIKYGFHADMNYNGIKFTDTALQNILITTYGANLEIMRYPGGIANSFNWETGQDDAGSPFTNTLEDLKAICDATGCVPLFTLNMVTKTKANQLAMLAAWKALTGDDPQYIEFGNEINVETSPTHQVFPTKESYFSACEDWAADIKALYPACLCGIYGENKTWSPDWNDGAIVVPGIDAIVTHIGPHPDEFSLNGVADMDKLNDLVDEAWIDSGMDVVTELPIWVTEFNYNYDENNLLTDESAYKTTLFLIEKITALITANNPGLKIMCVRRLVGNEGAVKDDYTISPTTGKAFQDFVNA